jgi:hypothetical protein
MDKSESQLSLSRSSVNFERMPIVFLGTREEKKKLEIEIATNGKPLVLHDTVQDGQGKRLSLTPSSAYGLLSGFDMDVLTVIYHKLYELAKETGACPEEARLSLSDFPKTMKLKTSGIIYEKIKESVKRISETTIYQENYIKIKETETGSLQSYQETTLKLVEYKGLRKDTLVRSAGNERMKKLYIDLRVPDWVRNNINNNYTSEFDPEIYFSIKGDRARRVYRILELIRYKREVFVPNSKLEKDLNLSKMPNKFKTQTIKRALEPLKKIEFIVNYNINEAYVYILFKEAKKIVRSFVGTEETKLSEMEEAFLNEVIMVLGDESSRAWLSTIVKKVPMESVYKCLSLTKETIELSGIKKSKGAIFTDHIKRECQMLKISL